MKHKILIVLTSSFPDTLNTGGKQAVYGMIDYLRNYMEISLLYDGRLVSSQNNECSLIQKWNDVSFVKYEVKKFSKKRLHSFLNRISNNFLLCKPVDLLNREFSYRYPIEDDFINLIHKTINDNQIEIVQLEFYTGIDLVYSLPPFVKKVFIQHEIRYVRNHLFLLNSKEQYEYSKLLVNKGKQEEILAMNQYDVVITLTENDKLKLLSDGVQTKIEVSPACLFATEKQISFIPSKNTLTFLGGSGHIPNLQGFRWFVNKVLPLLMKENVEINIRVIGNWNKKYVSEFSEKYKNIQFEGVVDDLSSVLAGSIMIIPIQVGSGMRMKALEAVRNGCTVVSTKVGIEGLPFVDREDSIIEDDENLWAIGICALLKSPSTQKKYWENSKVWYDRYYSTEYLGNKRKQIYDEL